MRVLILFALFACVASAPQYLQPLAVVPPVVSPVVPPLLRTSVLQPVVGAPAVVAVAPNLPAGDLQAAAINAQVRADDQARALVDKAREIAEQAIENQNEGIIEGTDLAKERSEEAFWANEDRKWQALDAAQTAEAALGGALSSNDVAKSPLTYVAGIVPSLPEVAAPADAAANANEAQKAEVKDAGVKSAEAEKPVEAAAVEEKKESADQKSVETKSAAAEATESVAQDAKSENVDQSASAFRSVIHPVPVGISAVPYSYQSIVPNVQYLQRSVFPSIPQPIYYNNLIARHF